MSLFQFRAISSDFIVLILFMTVLHSWPQTTGLEFASSPQTTIVDVKGQGVCCKKGSFFMSSSFAGFLSTPLGQELTKTYGLKLVYCETTQLFGPLFFPDPETPCRCDCQYAHGASDYDYDCSSLLRANDDVPCICRYLESDITIKPNSQCPDNKPKSQLYLQVSAEQQEPKPEKHSDIGNATRTGKTGKDEGVCEYLFDSARKLLCDAIVEENDANYYLVDGNKIFPEDVCAIDCYFVHGFRTPPYGKCCTTEGGKQYCVCVAEGQE